MGPIYQPTDVVLAKVKGYPAWPAMVVPNELIPENVLRTKHQQTSKRKTAADDDPTNGEEDDLDDDDPSKFIVYSDILKFKKFTTARPQYCVKFFCDDSYIWVKSADLKPLTVEQCNTWLAKPSSRNKKLIPAFEMASKGSDGIDVWEFIEYGSAGKPGEEEYVESYDEEEEEDVSIDENSGDEYEEGRRKSTRQKHKRQKQAPRNRRATRSRRQSNESDDEPPESEDEVIVPKAKRAKVKGKSKGKPTIPKYKYEDDEDWTLVGMGPQDLSIQKFASPYAKTLSQKRQFDDHVETKLELADRLHGINKLLLDILLPNERKGQNSRDGYEVLLYELSEALSTRGFHDKFLTVFQSNNELLSYFRLLFNMKGEDLRKWDFWDELQQDFESIYRYKFIPDQEEWSRERQLIEEVDVPIEENGKDAIRTSDIKQEQEVDTAN